MDASSLIQKLFPRGAGGARQQVSWLVAGLGNPGPKYKDTRHNVGWWTLGDLAERGRAKFKSSGANAETAEIEVNEEIVLLLRPLTFVNRSGDAVRHLMRKHQVEADHLIVIYDDLNLEPGKIRMRKQGGAGGHNGMKSIISSLATEEFARIRIGVGRPATSDEQVDYVLGRMAPQERAAVRAAAGRAADAVEATIHEGMDTAMNRFNGQ